MFCVNCGKAIENNAPNNLCDECNEKYFSPESQEVCNEKIIDGVTIRKNYGLANGILGYMFSFFATLCYVLVLVFKGFLFVVNLGYEGISRIENIDVESLGRVINVLNIINYVVLGMLAIFIFFALYHSIKGLKRASFARKNGVNAKASFVVNVIGMVVTSITSVIGILTLIFGIVMIVINFILYK